MQTITTPADFDQYGAIGTVTELVPITGRGAPVAPATYASNDGAKAPFEKKIARSHNVPIPVRGDSGEFDDLRRDSEGKLVLGDAVSINGHAAEAHRLSDALRDIREINWGGIVVVPPSIDRIAKMVDEVRKRTKDTAASVFNDPNPDTAAEIIVENIARTSSSSWTASHRHADAVIRYADDPATDQQVWCGGDLKRAMITADPLRDATWLLRNGFNSLLFGFWNSNSGAVVRAKMARAISASITGYGVHLVSTGTTKGSDLGDISNQLLMHVNEDGQLEMLPEATTEKAAKAKGVDKPSVFGLGMVLGPLGASAVSCETILRRSTLSLARLRSIRFGNGSDASKKRTAAVRALAAAGMYATAVITDEVCDLRSGAVMSPSSTVWTAHGRGGAKVALDVDVDTALSVLLNAMSDLDSLGLGQAEPIELTYSDAILQAMANSSARKKKGSEAGDSQ